MNLTFVCAVTFQYVVAIAIITTVKLSTQKKLYQIHFGLISFQAGQMSAYFESIAAEQ